MHLIFRLFHYQFTPYIELHGWHSPPAVRPGSLRPHCRPPPCGCERRRSIVSPFPLPFISSHRPLQNMSRRATPGQAAQNQQIIKSLLKLECNKLCADCKRNKRGCPISPPRCQSAHSDPYRLSQELGLLTWSLHRSTMGVFEPRYLYLHSLLGHSPWHGHTYQSGQVR